MGIFYISKKTLKYVDGNKKVEYYLNYKSKIPFLKFKVLDKRRKEIISDTKDYIEKLIEELNKNKNYKVNYLREEVIVY